MANIEALGENQTPGITNPSTRLYVVVVGILGGLGAMAHGVFEILQGNQPTQDILARIGAFTLLPNYLAAGIAVEVVGVFLLAWTIGFIHKRYGLPVYLLAILMLFLAGGGFAPIFGLLIAWAVATGINRPLTWWKRAIPEKTRKGLARFWPVFFMVGFILLLIGISIWLFFTPPGEMYQINTIDYICWSFLGLGLVCQIFTILAGFARDIERRGGFLS